MSDEKLARDQLAKDFPQIKNGRYLEHVLCRLVSGRKITSKQDVVEVDLSGFFYDVYLFYQIVDNGRGNDSAHFVGLIFGEELRQTKTAKRKVNYKRYRLHTISLRPMADLNDLTINLWNKLDDMSHWTTDTQRGMDGQVIKYFWSPSKRAVRLFVDDAEIEFVYQYGRKGESWLWHANQKARTLKDGIGKAIYNYNNRGNADPVSTGGGFLSDLNTDKKKTKKKTGRQQATTR